MPDDTEIVTQSAETVEPEPVATEPDQTAEGTNSTAETESAAQSEGEDTAAFADDEYNAAVAALPEDARKVLNKVLTKKFQTAAEKAKLAEGFEEFINSYKSDPVETAKALARHHKLLTEAAEAAKTDPKSDSLNLDAKLREALGDELGFLADKLAPVLEDFVKPFHEKAQAMEIANRERQVEADLATLTSKYPDWKKHESKMMELAKELKPAQGSSGIRYLEILYKAATSSGDAARIVQKMAEGAKKSDSKPVAVPQKRVTIAPGKVLTLKEAADYARRGIRVD